MRQKIKHYVYVDVDNTNGCMNCKYDIGSICSIMNCGTHDYLEGVSECGLNIGRGKMNEKRFNIFDDDEVEDVWNELKSTIYCYDEEEAQRCENWLNNLHNKNQKLKEENEQLKQEIVVYKKAFQQQVQRCTL